jgi:hypothetical protein
MGHGRVVGAYSGFVLGRLLGVRVRITSRITGPLAQKESLDMSENENDQTIAAPRSDCSTDRIDGSEQSQKGMWQEALIDVSACLTVEALVRAGVKPKTIYAMRNALESPRLRL